MEKRIPYDVFMSVKRVAQACNPIMSKRESVKAKIQKLQEEYAFYDKQVSALEAGIKNVTGFRVEELVKKVKQETGQHKVTIRNIRRNGNDTAKKLKENGIPEDEQKKLEEDIQKLTNEYIAKLDKMSEMKEKEIMTV